MKIFDDKALPERFSKLNLIKGDTILIHSSLLHFGKPLYAPFSKLNEIFFHVIHNQIGSEGTIAVPTFNFDFCHGVPFNRQKSPSKGTGVFSEYIRQLPGSGRSFHPMQSISVIGQHRDFIIENDTESSFNLNGPFDKLKQLDGKILLLGADFNSVSMIHWVEERYSVPYRYWKTFSGAYIDQELCLTKSYKMFVRSKEINPILQMNKIEKELIRTGKLEIVKIGEGIAKVFKIADYISIAENLIIRNPYFFVSNHPKFEHLE